MLPLKRVGNFEHAQTCGVLVELCGVCVGNCGTGKMAGAPIIGRATEVLLEDQIAARLARMASMTAL